MKNIIKQLFAFISISLLLSLSAQAEDVLSESTPGFISDDLFIYMHAGPGTNYKILGSITAGEEVKVTGEQEDSYSQIVNSKNRTAWVESKYLKTEPGIRKNIGLLENKIANARDFSSQLDGEVNDLRSTIESTKSNNRSLTNEINQLKSEIANTKNQLKGQDAELKKQWFFTGAIVLSIGLIFGLIIPKFFSRRSSNMDSWK